MMKIVAKAVVDYPAAVGIELMNEPPLVSNPTIFST